MSESRTHLDAVPAPALVLGAAISVQFGAAFAIKLFPTVGPLGAVWLRLAISAVLMAGISRPRLRTVTTAGLASAVGFGVVLAAMNFSFYLAINRIPLGPAVTVEFLGPLAVAVAGSRRALDLLWVALAGIGVFLLADSGRSQSSAHPLDGFGLMFAGIAGACWIGYILLSQRVGRHFDGMAGLSIALIVGAVGLAPFALARHGAQLAHPRSLLIGAGIAVLSSAVPYSIELAALRRLRAATFGVLLSLDPAVAALSGLLLLGQRLRLAEWLALVAVIVASAAASISGRPSSPDPEAAGDVAELTVHASGSG